MSGRETELGDFQGPVIEAAPVGGIVVRAIRSQQLWLTVGYFAVLLLLARAYS
ncbi:MAG: hypothetical protein OZ948_14900 [Deltaproteobacteria bacterium]|nr:hypothetical protein [Deltaproteobacteria bacterium]